MSKLDKIIQKIFANSPAVSVGDVKKVLTMLGFSAGATVGSHLTYRKAGYPSITIVITQNPVKPYILKKIKQILIIEGYSHE